LQNLRKVVLINPYSRIAGTVVVAPEMRNAKAAPKKFLKLKGLLCTKARQLILP